MTTFVIRPARESDLPRFEELQTASPEAAQWSGAQYLSSIIGVASLECRVAEIEGRAEALIVYRAPVAGESEVLNLAVAPEYRRHGLGRALVSSACGHATDVFLEVRASNRGGIEFYRHCGFEEAGRRADYYHNPREDAIVMKRTGSAPRALADRTPDDK